jgi:hypothetical protein
MANNLGGRVARLETQTLDRCPYCRLPFPPPPNVEACIARLRALPKEEYDSEYHDLLADAPFGRECRHCGKREPGRYEHLFPPLEEMRRLSTAELEQVHRDAFGTAP